MLTSAQVVEKSVTFLRPLDHMLSPGSNRKMQEIWNAWNMPALKKNWTIWIMQKYEINAQTCKDVDR